MSLILCPNMTIVVNHSLTMMFGSTKGQEIVCHGNTKVSLRPNVCYRLVAPVSLESSFWIQKLGTDARKWILRPVTAQGPAPVTNGNYRIRSYNNNQYLLTMSLADDAKCYVTQQLRGDKIQQQTVVSFSTYYPYLWTDLEILSGR